MAVASTNGGIAPQQVLSSLPPQLIYYRINLKADRDAELSLGIICQCEKNYYNIHVN